MMGALLQYISEADPKEFQPMKANFGLLPQLEKRVRRKRDRYAAYASRALADLTVFVDGVGELRNLGHVGETD